MDKYNNFFSLNELDIIKKTKKRYQDLSEEEKNKKWEYGHKQYKTPPKVEKQRLVEYKNWLMFLISNSMEDIFRKNK